MWGDENVLLVEESAPIAPKKPSEFVKLTRACFKRTGELANEHAKILVILALCLIVVIITVSLLILGLQAYQKTVPDKIFYNATVYTAEDSDVNRTYEAIAIGQTGKISFIGSNAEALALSNSYYFNQANLFNLQQRALYPGFIDAHAHLLSLGKSLTQADLVGSRSVQEVNNRLLLWNKNNRTKGGWLQARGWDQTRFPGKQFPSREDLDFSFPDIPVWLVRIDGHAGWLNTAALNRIQVPAQDAPGGVIVRDAKGVPTGIFIDNAMDLVTSAIPPLTDSEIDNLLTEAARESAKNGIVMVHDAGVDYRVVQSLERLVTANSLPIRVYAMISSGDVDGNSGGDDPSTPAFWCEKGFMSFKDRLFVRSTKILLDGALGSRGAALLAPYSDDANNSGQLLISAETLYNLTSQWAACGFQVNTHAIGDRATRLTLDTYARVLRENPTLPDLRLRVEHAQIINESDIATFKTHNIIASVQPTHATSDMGYAEDRLGPVRIKNAYLWQTLLNNSISIAFGSDFPVEQVSPLLGIYAAITRQDTKGLPAGGWYPEERVSNYFALQGFTKHAAYAAFQEASIGTLAVGKFADFVILEQDILALASFAPIEIPNVRVTATYVAGAVSYSSDSMFL